MSSTSTAVLLANDGDTPDPAAAQLACDLAGRLGARLCVVHVARQPRPLPGTAPPSKVPAYAVLATLVAQCASTGGLVTRANLRLGEAEQEILDEAEEVEAGLIVVADGADDHDRRPEGGGLGERLGGRATCPVLIVRAAAGDQRRAAGHRRYRRSRAARRAPRPWPPGAGRRRAAGSRR